MHNKINNHHKKIETDKEIEQLLNIFQSKTQNISFKDKEEDLNFSLNSLLDDINNYESDENNILAHKKSYLEDLKSVLSMPNNAGIRVLRYWLDSAYCFSKLSLPSPEIYMAAALNDYAKDRMAEVAMADPASFIRIQLASTSTINNF